MKVSKTSWHYKLIKFFNESFFYSPKSDCQYFRQLIASMILVVLMVAVCLAAVIGVFCSIITPFMIMSEGFNQFMIDLVNLNWQEIVPIAALLYMGYFVAIVAFTSKYIKTKYEEKIETEQPGVLVSWIKAKKDKICSKVELVD